jgi:hypothetical protein
MSGDELLTTSPLLFGYTGRDGRLGAIDARAGTRFRLSSERVADLITAFLEPRPASEAMADGFSHEELEQAREAGILVREQESEALGLWERNGWSRPAYLLFSQMDIPYEDEPARNGEVNMVAATEHRRTTIEAYETEGDRPRRRRLARGPTIQLPAANDVPPQLASLTARRSARGFSAVPPSAEQLAAVLGTATKPLRSVLADQAAPDPFLRLNSFYSWAHLLVVAQEVDGVPPGAYEYDPERHVLLGAADPPEPTAVLASVQGQRGILGPGFVIYVVADFGGYAWIYRHSRAYLHILIQLGELGQELLTAATGAGLVGWTTPAVHESRAGALFGLPADDRLEVLSMVKLGRPRR